jgi:hypothetical protein
MVSHKKAHKAHKAQKKLFWLFVLYVPFVALLGCGCDVAGTGAKRNVLAGGGYLDFAIAFVTIFVERIVSKHVLRAKLGCDLCESIRKGAESVCAKQPPT